jgi:hypothetical protein
VIGIDILAVAVMIVLTLEVAFAGSVGALLSWRNVH